jgi:protein TonB
MSYAVQKEPKSRLAGLAVVVAFHLALIYALVHGLARQIVEVIRQPLETKIIEEIKAPPPDKPPPPPPPKLTTPPPPYIPPPEVQVQVPVVMAPTITAVTDVKPPPEPVRTAPVVDASTCDKPAYPPASLRSNETGTVRLRFLIDVDGKVMDSKIERTSGSRRLDEAARAGLSLCKFRPATLNGRPEQTWGRIDYVWKIE